MELARHLLEQRARPLLFAHHGDACLDDRGVGSSNAGSPAHRRGEIPGPDATIHSCRMVGTRQEIRENCQYLGFQPGGQLLRPPNLPDFVLSATVVALRNQDASKCQPAFHARRLTAQEPSHRGRVALLLPKRSLGTRTDLSIWVATELFPRRTNSIACLSGGTSVDIAVI